MPLTENTHHPMERKPLTRLEMLWELTTGMATIALIFLVLAAIAILPQWKELPPESDRD